MKKYKKHILIVCLLLLFGIGFLTLSVHAASTFSWLKGTDSGQSQSQSVKGHSKTARITGKEAGNILLSPIAGSFLPGSTSGNSAAGGSGSTGAKAAAVDEGPLEPSLTETISGGATDFSGSGSGCNSIDGSASGTSSEAPKPSGSGSGSSGKSSGSSGINSSPSGNSSGSSGNNSGNSSGTTGSGSSSGSTSSSGSSSGSSGSRRHHHDHGSSTVCISKVTLDKSDLALKKGETAALTATVSPSNTTQDKNIVWSSSNTAIATVDSTGKVTAVEGGKAAVTAKSSNGKTAVCSVTVSVPATAITLNLSDAPVERGKTLTLTAALEPANSTDVIHWTSSHKSVATVDSTGKVTGVAPGTTTITASSAGDGTISASCKITTVVSISELDLSDTDLTLKKGEEHTLTATIKPKDTTEDKTVVWSSSNESVATVSSTGKVTAVEGGTAILTAQTGKHSAQCAVTVVVPVTGIKFESDTVTVAKGTTEALAPIFTPADATDRAVAWGSSDKSVAEVDKDGKVTGVSVGTATVTAITHDGGYVAQCTVKVVVPVTGISLDKVELSLIKGHTAALMETITPGDATDKAVTWSSTNPSVAAVDNSGKVTAVGGGSAEITVKTKDGGYTASCKVTVTVPVTGISLNTSSLTLMPGSSSTLTATITPSDATNQKVTWRSSNPSVISVDQNGRVRANSSGSATITVTSRDGGYAAQCRVTTEVTWTEEVIDYIQKGDRELSHEVGETRYLNDCSADAPKYYYMGDGYYSDVTYTFTDPLTVQRGDRLQLTLYQYSDDVSAAFKASATTDGDIWENLSVIGTTSDYSERKLSTSDSYRFTSSHVITSITVRAYIYRRSVIGHHENWAVCSKAIAKLTVGGQTFMLNNSGTSANQ